jgi:ABC-type lipoprotein release transport system permease subunit
VNVVFAWLRLDLRRRWQSLVVLTLLVAVAGGLVVASLAGARRAASAQTRLLKPTLPTTATVLANTPGFDWSKVKALPEVEGISLFSVDYAIALVDVPGSASIDFPFVDGEFGHTFETPIMSKGRVPNPATVDEVMITRKFASTYHKGVGDTVELALPAASQIDTLGLADSVTPDQLHGPRITLHIVGIGESPWFSDDTAESGVLQLSAGLVAKYPLDIIGNQSDPNNPNFLNALVRLRGGESAIPQFRADLARVTGRSDLDVGDLWAQYRDGQRSLSFEARSLVAFAGAALIAALFLIGQAIVRYAAASTSELQTLRALGMTPRQSVVMAAAGPAIIGCLGAVVAIVIGYLASHWTPIGSASRIEPHPGLSFDWVVFGPGLVVIAVLVSAGATVAAWLAVGAARRTQVSRTSSVAAAVARAGLPAPVVIGTRFALEAGRGRTSVPVRPALIGAIVGVLGIVGAFTFARGVNDAAGNLDRFGQTYQSADFAGYNSQNFGPTDKVISALQADPNVTGVDDALTAVATGPGGNDSISLYEYSGGNKPIPVVITSGRMAAAADEIVLAPRTLAAMHTAVGKRVQLTGSNGSKTFTVTGSGLVVEGPHNSYADGGWVTGAGYNSIFKGFKFRIVLVSLRKDAQGPNESAALTAAISKNDASLSSVSFSPPEQPSEVQQLREVRKLPIALGIFLVLLALGAVGHALATAVRRRAHDLAVLRALGMTQGQCRWVVVTQATVLAIIGLIFGVPLGVAIGRTVWRSVATYTPLQYVPPLAFWALVLVAPAALVIANLLAAWPGHRAARLRIAQILRAE